MIRRRSVCAFLALGALHAAGASSAQTPPDLLRAITEQLANEPVLRGEFEQRKSITGFRNPLLSRGDFIVARERGVFWRTVSPFASSLVITPERMLLRQADGRVLRHLQASEEPALRAIGQTLFALFSSDLSELARRFRIEGQHGASGWRLTLQPIDANLARWLQRVELEGQRFLRTVVLVEASGDQTQIRLMRHATASALTPLEVALFD